MLVLLIVGVIISFIFLLWERHLPLQGKEPEPVFPWRMATDRFVMGNLLNSFFVGSTFFVVVINLPQRSQIVNGFSPFEAGYHLLALTISTPLGSTIAVFLTQKAKVPPLYILIGSAVIQIIGLAIMSTLSTHTNTFQPAVYGYEVIIGVGFGLNMGTVVLLAPLVFSKQDMGTEPSPPQSSASDLTNILKRWAWVRSANFVPWEAVSASPSAQTYSTITSPRSCHRSSLQSNYRPFSALPKQSQVYRLACRTK